jgi:hypothetical protein
MNEETKRELEKTLKCFLELSSNTLNWFHFHKKVLQIKSIGLDLGLDLNLDKYENDLRFI